MHPFLVVLCVKKLRNLGESLPVCYLLPLRKELGKMVRHFELSCCMLSGHTSLSIYDSQIDRIVESTILTVGRTGLMNGVIINIYFVDRNSRRLSDQSKI